MTELDKQASEDYADKEANNYLLKNPFPSGFNKESALRLMDLFYQQSKKDFLVGCEYKEKKVEATVIEFAKFITDNCYHVLDMDYEMVKKRANNEWCVIYLEDEKEDLYVKDTKSLYKLFLKSKNK